MKLDDLPVPDSAAATAALEVATAYCSPALRNHSVRAYLWGAGYAYQRGIAFDAELLYVAAMLHDIGLVAAFDSHTVDFEYAGGHVAWVFCAGTGWPVERRQRVADVIVRHMWSESDPALDPALDPEGHLLAVSTGMDISGGRVGELPARLRAEVLAAYPRLGLASEFSACFADQAARKPASTAASAVRNGLAARIATNPLDAG
jgi:hypothetical protein